MKVKLLLNHSSTVFAHQWCKKIKYHLETRCLPDRQSLNAEDFIVHFIHS